VAKMVTNLKYLEIEYGDRHPSQGMAEALDDNLQRITIDQVFEEGLHEFITDFLKDLAGLGLQIETDYRFLG